MKKNRKCIRKFVTLIIVLITIINLLPIEVLASNVSDAIAQKEFEDKVINNPQSENSNADAEILFEVKEKRDEHTKVYKKSDGSYTAIKTEDSLHYLDDGVWEEINNSMVLDGKFYTNTKNLFNVEFPENIASNESLTVENDGYELSFSVDDIAESTGVIENNMVDGNTDISVADEAISQTQSSITYNEVAENTDLQYIVTPNSIKENIIVSDKDSVKDTYIFTFETNGLNAEKRNDCSIVFKDEFNEIKFHIPRPVMNDANFTFSYDIDVDLIENADNTITLEYSPSKEWTSSAERVYPITIDPAIGVNCEEDFVEYMGVGHDSNENEFVYKTVGDPQLVLLCSGFETEDSDGIPTTVDNGICVKIDTEFFSELGDDILFTEVHYFINGLTESGGKIFAREITSDWISTPGTYSTKHTLSENIIDYYTSPISENEEYDSIPYIHFNITDVFNGWFNSDKDNNGFEITINEGKMAFVKFNNNSSTGTLVLDYVDLSGYDENLNYHTQAAGRAGTGYVNDFTQTLTVIRDDIKISDTTGTIGMIYNSAAYKKLKSLGYSFMLKYGNNWLPNYLKAIWIDEENGGNVTYYTGTGSSIDFAYSNEENAYKELYSETYSDYGYELEYKSNEYIITRPDGYVERFNRDGLLNSVTTPDNTQQPINIAYDSSGRISCITDFNGDTYYYEYNLSTNLLSGINCYRNNSTESQNLVSYVYNASGNLTEVNYGDGKHVVYEYDADNKITAITNTESSKIEYVYDDTTGRIETVVEQEYNGTDYVNKKITCFENLSSTQVKITENNNYEIYQFNKKGDFLYKFNSEQVGNTTLENEVNLIKNGQFTEESAHWSSTGNLDVIDETINGENVKALKLSALSDTQNVIYQTVVSDDGFKKNDTIEFSGWFKGNFIKSKTNNLWLLDLIKNSEDEKICNFSNDRFAQIEVSYQYTGVNEFGEEEILPETVILPFNENIDDWQYATDVFILKGDCDELLVTIRYSNNANSGLISNIELIQNGGYTIDYDGKNRLERLFFGNREVLFYSYNENNKINKIVYNNSAYQKSVTEFTYNSGKVDSIKENNKTKYKFLYNNDKNLIGFSTVDNRIIRYADDITGLSAFTNSQYHSIKNNGNEFVEILDKENYTTTVENPEYTIISGASVEKSSVVAETAGNSIAIISQQDWFGRRQNCIVEAGNMKNTDSEKTFAVIENEFSYISDTEFSDLNRVSTYINKISCKQVNDSNSDESYSYCYEYNENGNLIKEYNYISENSIELRYSYAYDEENRLIRYNDNVSNPKRSFSYEYDGEGNLISKSTYSYVPFEIELSDPLSTEYYSYDHNIENNGNVCYADGKLISVNGGELIWNGNQLASYTISENNITKRISYNYNSDGLLIGKTIEVKPENSSDEMYQVTERYNYTWAYGKLINETCTKTENGQQTTYTVKYVYDSFNSVQGFIFNHSETYLYLKNLKGDIMGIVNESGEVVLSYEYNDCGVPSTKSKSTDGNYDFIELLPIKYRGCFYDYDTNLYYVNGEFLNTDTPNNPTLKDSSFGYSLFSYWENQPLCYKTDECEVYYANSIANYLFNLKYTANNEDAIFGDGYIHDQLGSSGNYRYGYITTQSLGCGWIATYNAAKILGLDIPPCEIIREYELNGLLAYGCFGLQPLAIAQFFIRRGYDVNIKLKSAGESNSGKSASEDFDDLAGMYDANILFYVRENRMTNHYIALNKVDDYYLAYNLKTNVKDVDYIYNTLEDYFEQNQSILISISKIEASV